MPLVVMMLFFQSLHLCTHGEDLLFSLVQLDAQLIDLSSVWNEGKGIRRARQSVRSHGEESGDKAGRRRERRCYSVCASFSLPCPTFETKGKRHTVRKVHRGIEGERTNC